MTISAVINVFLAYLLGSLSCAIMVSRAAGIADPRSYGSGNPGATNVLRTGKKLAAAATVLGDGAKGWVAVVLSSWLGPRYNLGEQSVALAGLAVLVGHMWPVFFSFKGGKGAATALGVLLGFNAWLALAALATWLVLALSLRISSLAALVACILAPVYAYFTIGQHSVFFGTTIIMALLVLHRHKSNIIKLLSGQEDKIGRQQQATDRSQASERERD